MIKDKCDHYEKCLNIVINGLIVDFVMMKIIYVMKMDRFKVNKIRCIECKEEQDVSNKCIKCQVVFADSFCEFVGMDKDKINHCDKCVL